MVHIFSLKWNRSNNGLTLFYQKSFPFFTDTIMSKRHWFLFPSLAPSLLFSEERWETCHPITFATLWQIKMYCLIGFLSSTAAALEKLMKHSCCHSNMFFFCISFCWKTKDPMVTITLDDHTTIFDLTTAGLIRYLRLLKPVDREKQQFYTFTVGLGRCSSL